jgi:hypothetical protein
VSALINPTFWLLIAVCVAAIGRRASRGARFAALLNAATSWPVLALVSAVVAANVSARGLIGLVVPGDFVQEVVAARSFQSEGTLYTPDINGDVEQWLRTEPPSVPSWLPDPVQRYLRERQAVGRNRLVAQAHPPTLLMAVAPWIWLFGADVTYILLSLASIAAAVISSQLLLAAWKPAPSPAERWFTALAVISWQPVLASVRDGQISVIIGAFLVAAWSAARKGRFLRGGVVVGMASALKLYPAVVLVLLALRRRAALGAALSVLAAAGVLATVIAGVRVWDDYLASARAIGHSFAGAPHNLSVVARVAPATGVEWLPFWYAAACAGLLAVTLLAVGSDKWSGREAAFSMDLDFGLFVCLAMLLSPVAWHHYTFMLIQPLAVALGAAHRAPQRWPLVCWALGVLALTLPDDAIRQIWAAMSPGAFVLGLLSPGLIVLLLWAALVYLRLSCSADGAVRVGTAATASV